MNRVIAITPNPALDFTLHVQSWQRGRVNRGEAMQVTPGGKALTVALNLADAGIHSAVTGWMGAHNDAPFRRAFITHGLCDDFIRYPGDIRRCIKIVDQDDTTDFNMPGHAVPEAAVAALSAYLDQNIDDDTVLIFGGSLPQGIAEDYYAQQVARYRHRVRAVLVDTSDAALKALMQAELLPHIIKPNIHELAALVGRELEDEADIIACARQYLARGVELAVISAGARGAWFVRQDEAVFAKPPKVKVVSTVGAGDAMVAGTVRGLLLNRSLAEMAQTATAYSVANIMHVGVQLPAIGEIEKIKATVEVRTL